MHPLITLALAWMVLAASMLLTWILAKRLGKYGIVDTVWTYHIGLLAILYCGLTGVGIDGRSGLVLLACSIWSLRLGTHLLLRISSMEDDRRYQKLQLNWGAQAPLKMLRFYQYQAVANLILSLPILLAILNPAPLGWMDGIGFALAAMAILGEAMADYQLSRFKGDPDQSGKTCRQGLWRYSRHPNYFFTWLFWLALPFLANGHPWGFLAWISPIVMYFVLVHLTGIPPAEEQSLKSRGEDYRHYQKETNAFFPGPPRKVD